MSLTIQTYLADMPAGFWFFASFCISFLVAAIAYPAIIYVAYRKDIMAVPSSRSAHTKKVPNLGGVGIFMGVFFVLAMIGGCLGLSDLMFLMAGLIILFFLGVKDDLVILTAGKKFGSQILVSLMIIVLMDIRIHSFGGVFGLHDLSYLPSVSFTVFVFVLLINAYNLIDGIDGLAGSVGLLSSLTFGVFFVSIGLMEPALVSFALVGALVPFLYYNFSGKKKMFMGDTGTMIVGFLLAYLCVAFIGINQNLTVPETLGNSAILGIAFVFYPLMDTLRVFVVRAFQGKSPFTADKNHIHHRLLNLGLNHTQSTIFIVLCSMVLGVLAFYTQELNINLQAILVIACGMLLFLFPYCFERREGKVYFLKHYRSRIFDISN
ncbi:undecaprenyl/decaprenyl-phosphate alpha-N-acetylglucosaminyl 1-phosphate transferase [Flavobacteriaceae bacterium F89]|uniref:Undecaprenyl/decaprenyl-phosphate alpha-N-acetylglucosaminyl 1-phosphate transferase n=1 Tax=Cerina litoralis TaxID=2874477 RepID=A0AAE3EU38_9FLAO|nr:MraY family glycosyltransferase [Cerina litoralis]MCG2461003.1 undecaprenyl/decaprenyl-phosphate alpha-N-acetylglucosaminyl 1-phosphate transferase [Cerina litoralis]